ncbi:hypothetical protein L9F63_003487, partial [Diploptera punctata]
MGNLQGSEGKKGAGGGTGKSPGKGKKDKGKKSPAKELLRQHKSPAPPPPSAQVQQQKVVPPQGNVQPTSSHASVASNNGKQQQTGETTTYVVTDSWRHVKKLAIKTPASNNTLLTPPSRDSSSESVFTDPLTPQGFAEAQNSSITSSYYSDPCSNGKTSNVTPTRGVNGVDSVFGVMGLSDKEKRGDADLDDITLTLVDSQEQLTEGDEPMTAVVQKRAQSHSLDALDEEENFRAYQEAPSSFTLVRHRKVELNPTRLSEHCLLP